MVFILIMYENNKKIVHKILYIARNHCKKYPYRDILMAEAM